ncbi:MAG: hypothetical protein LIO46_02870 [Clostridiales bacterium]|nr:hypothetical protein [Clostridiales bacterium]
MWISRQLNRHSREHRAEPGTITLDTGSRRESVGTAQQRGTRLYAPYGYASTLPEGTEVLLLPTQDGSVCCGCAASDSDLAAGEIRIRSAHGGFIHLKRDGSVTINGLVITRDGKLAEQEE